jgi:hypothetical protein
VQKRISGGLCVEVIHRLAHEQEIGAVSSRGTRAWPNPGLFQRRKQPCSQETNGQEHETACRQKSPHSSGIKIDQVNPAGLQGLSYEEFGDQVARKNKKDVDADKTSGESRNPNVVGHYHEDGNAAQAFDVAPKRRFPLSKRRADNHRGLS